MEMSSIDEKSIELARAKTPVEVLDHLTTDQALLIIVDAMEKVSDAGVIHRFNSTDILSAKEG